MKKSLVIAAALAALTTLAHAGNGAVTGTIEAKPAKYAKDTIVYIVKVDGTKLEPKTVTIDQKGMEFAPHVALDAIGDTIVFENHDKVDHNVTSPEGHYDLGTWGAGAKKSQKLDKPGVYSQVCKLHPEMLAYVFVGQNRFAAVVGADGKFAIADVPPGSYELAVWNPKLKAATQKIIVAAAATANAHFALAR